MQSFKYTVPSAPPPPSPAPRPRLPRAAGIAALVAALGAGGWWLVSGPIASGLSSVFSSADPAVHARAAARAMAAGEAALARRAFKEATRHFAAALNEAPDNRQAWSRLARAHYMAGDEALPPIERLLAAPASRVSFAIAEGEAELAAHHPAAALAAFERAIALESRHAQAVAGRARALMAVRRPDDALEAFEEARRLAPDDAAIAAAHIKALYEAGKSEAGHAAAEAAFGRAAGRTADPRVQIGLVESWVRQGLDAGAIKTRYAQSAAQLSEPQRQRFVAEAFLRHYQGNPNWNKGSFEQAVAAAKVAAADPRTRAEAESVLARAYDARSRRALERSEFASALADVDQALALRERLKDQPETVAGLYARRAQLMGLLGRPGEVNPQLEASLRFAPTAEVRAELVKSYANIGVGLMGVRKADAALQPLSRALALAPDDPVLHARYYQALVRARKPEPLALTAKAAGHGDEAYARWMVVRGSLTLGERQTAKRLVDGAAPGPAGAAARAEWALATDQQERAQQALKQAMSQSPATPRAWRALGEMACTLARADAPHKAAHFASALDAFGHALAAGESPALLTRLRETHRAAAEAALAAKQPQAAVAAAARGLMLEPHDPWCALALGTALSSLKRPAEAGSVLKAGLEGLDAADHPAHARMREQLGRVLEAEQHHAEAANEFKAGLAQDVKAPPPVCADLYYGLAFSLAESGEKDEALSAARQYVFWSLHDPLQAERAPQVQALEQRLSKP